MDFLKQLADYIQFGMEILLAVFILGLPLKRKKFFPLYVVATILVIDLISFLFVCFFHDFKSIDTTAYRHITPLLFTTLIIPSILYCLLAYQDKVAAKAFCLISALFLRNLVRKLYLLILLGIGNVTDNPALALTETTPRIWLLLYYPLMAIIYFIIGFLFVKQFKRTHLVNISWRISFVFVLALAVNLTFAPVENVLEKPSAAYTSLLFAEIFFGFVVFGLLFLLQYMTEEKMKTNIMEQQLENSKRQFDMIQENVDMINLKCHDMRHQLREAQLEGKLDEQYINDTIHQIDIYDCQTKTGNPVLDIILMDKKFHCSAKKIPFMVIADGSCINFMEKEDLIGLFSNILENAINFESRIADEEKRFISFTLAKKKSFIKIHCENATSEDLLPEEDKDPRFHGFGLISIKRIAEKYHGVLNTNHNDGMFQLDILIPTTDSDSLTM